MSLTGMPVDIYCRGIWRQLCDETGAELVEGASCESDEVVRKAKQWTITLDTYTDRLGPGGLYTRIRAPYVTMDGFHFKIYPRGIMDRLLKLFRIQDIHIGDPDFDREFIVRGNDESKVHTLFDNVRIRQLIQYIGARLINFKSRPITRLNVQEDVSKEFPFGIYELFFQEPGFVADVERLKSLFQLFEETLNQLKKIGSASEDDPSIFI